MKRVYSDKNDYSFKAKYLTLNRKISALKEIS